LFYYLVCFRCLYDEIKMCILVLIMSAAQMNRPDFRSPVDRNRYHLENLHSPEYNLAAKKGKGKITLLTNLTKYGVNNIYNDQTIYAF